MLLYAFFGAHVAWTDYSYILWRHCMNHQATRCAGENPTQESSPETSGSQRAIDRLELYATEAIGNEFAAVDLPKLRSAKITTVAMS